jgi:hypothetical protein
VSGDMQEDEIPGGDRLNVSYKIPCKVLIQINTFMLYRHTISSKQGLGHHDDSEAKIDPSILFAVLEAHRRVPRVVQG